MAEDAKSRYNHPYEPYEIQTQLMDAIYDTLTNGYKIGLFESPTGTGKTLSIICSTMTWLRHYKKNTIFNPPVQSDDGSLDDEPEWVKESYQKSVVSRTRGRAEDYERHLDEVERQHSQKRTRVSSIPPQKKLKKAMVQSDESEFVPGDYYSDSETTATDLILDRNKKLTAEISRLMDAANGNTGAEAINDCPVSMFYSSRTHTQLNQFAHQLNLTSFESSFNNLHERTKFLPLGSRKQLCIHPKVSKMMSLPSLNDACIDLQQSASDGCEYLPKQNRSSSIALVKEFADLSFTKIHDIEDLGDLGKELKTCPYYAVRENIPLTEIVALPYQMLLQDSTRDIMNLKIDDSIVIIDEAHNLFDVLNSMNSVSISLDDLDRVIKSLKVYYGRFLRRLNTGNRVNLLKLTKLCQVVQKYMSCAQNATAGDEISVRDIFQSNTGDMINIHKVEKFLSKSKIAYKIESYMEKLEADENKTTSSSNPLLFKITQFLKALSNPSKEGKLFWDNIGQSGKLSIQYMMLDPSEIFKDIVSRCKCLLLCGGTMQPISDYTDYLFPYIEQQRIKSFSCGHVIPEENLKVFPIGLLQAHQFEFLYEKRNDKGMILKLGYYLINLVKVIPDGVVIFFPSYRYLNLVLEIWKENRVLDILNKMKQLFQEPTDSGAVNSVLTDYAASIKVSRKGALLLSVVGGKMSEGINFSDELARAVIMIGLPYPNAFSGELIARKNFIIESTIRKGGSKEEAQKNAHNFYENICMRAVNQSIGRSIRHANDYSALYLFDSRYANRNIQSKLSGWVREKITRKAYLYPVNEVMSETRDFFNSKALSKMH